MNKVPLIILVPLVVISSFGCSTISAPPDFKLFEDQNYLVNDKIINLTIPKGGKHSNYKKLAVETKLISNNIFFLNSIGYDAYNASNASYFLTHIYFGLTKDGCCSIKKIRKDYANSKIKKECVNGTLWLFHSGRMPSGDYVAGYTTPFDSEFVLFLNIQIDKIKTSDIKFVKDRESILNAAVHEMGALNQNNSCI